MPDYVLVTLGGLEVIVPRARLGLFLKLNYLQLQIIEAQKRIDTGAISETISAYVQESLPGRDLSKAHGYEILDAYLKISEMNILVKDIPLLRRRASSGKSEPWDYEDRSTILWIHLLASAYNWPIDDIRNLWPEEAAAFIQEILVDHQLDREWIHSHSEVAYKFDKKGKGELVPLKRPGWMRPDGGPKTSKIPRRLLPLGTIIDLSGVSQGGSQ